MNRYPILFSLFVAMGLTFGAFGTQADTDSLQDILKNVDAREAIAIANEWRWTRTDVKSHVTSGEVVFELPGDQVKRVALPDDEMMVAVAPYINSTHQ